MPRAPSRPALWAAGLCAALLAAAPARAQKAPDPTLLSLEELLELRVTGAAKYAQAQSEVAAAVSVLTRGDIRNFGWRTLGEALASLPGLHLSYDRQYTYLGTRGFGLPGDLTARVLITLNGNRVNDPVYDGGPVGRELPIDLDLVERIEFFPGPGGAVYGQNAMFGVVNVVTRRGGDLDGVELAGGARQPQSSRDARASWGRRLDNGVEVLLSVAGMRSRGEDRHYDYGASGRSGVAAGLDGERDREFFAQLAHGSWTLDVVQGQRGKQDPTAAFFSDPLVSSNYTTDRYALAQLQYQATGFDGTLDASGRVFSGRFRFDSTLSYGSPVSFPAAGDWHGAELRVLSTAWAGHKLMLGLETQRNARIEQRLIDHADPAQDFSIATKGFRHGLYLQDEWRTGPVLVTTLGLRVDRNERTGTSTSPRAAVIWQATPATSLKALAGRAHRSPNAYESSYQDNLSQLANPGLGGERIDTLEFVVDHRAGTGLALRASVYRWTMHDLIVLGTEVGIGLTQYRNGARVQARGLELSADRSWGAGTRLRGSLSLQDVSSDNGGLPNSPLLLARVNLAAPLPWAGLRGGLEWQFDSRRLSLDGSRLGGYALANLQLASDRLVPGVTVALRVGNVFGKRYAQPGADTHWQNALAQDGRSLGLRLGLSF